MRDQPTTREDARKSRYGSWAGRPGGHAFNEKHCAAHIMTGGRGSLPTQCYKKPGHGPDGLYCKAHALEFFSVSESKPSVWWKTSKWSWDIEEVQVTHSTESFVWINGGARKESKRNEYNIYWETHEAARQHLIARAKAQISNAEHNLKEAKEALDKLNAYPPTLPAGKKVKKL